MDQFGDSHNDEHEHSPVLDDNQRLSNNENDFEHLTHSDAGDHHEEEEDINKAYTGSAIQHEPAVEFEYASPDPFEAPPPVHSRHIEHHEEETSPKKPTYVEEEDDVKGSDISVSSVEDDRSASEASELLKQRIPPGVRDIIYWHCPITSAGLLTSLLLFELSLLFYSVISVLAYTGLTLMLASVALKLYMHFVASDKSTSIHRYIEGDWSVSRERTEQVSRHILNKVNGYALYVRDLFLINNYGESIKFAILLYILTYIGAWFNFLTLAILCTVFTFSIPKVYDLYKREIDHVISLARRQCKEKWLIIRGKMEELPVVGQKLKRH